MRPNQGLEHRQSQLLVMTPQQIQAMKLLQMSNMDLSAHVAQEVEGNPFLEWADEEPESLVAGEPAMERLSAQGNDRAPFVGLSTSIAADPQETGQAVRRRFRKETAMWQVGGTIYGHPAFRARLERQIKRAPERSLESAF
ncbi:hypothetical protein [Bradyrhizobium sp. CB3481]|uniref:hypothetical protein n=1 Tax=Bradyrhizobium sp. CB3481 TaxID=3039158 RepID=UPI0032C215BD